MPFAQFRVVQISGWKLALAAVLVLALLFALFILAAGVFLLVLPVAAVAAAIAYLFGGRTGARGFQDDAIEVKYREIDQKEVEQDKK